MQVSVEVISAVKRRLKFIIPADKIEEAYATQLNHYAKHANLKGFRPGKIPLSYIQKRFGDEAKKEAYGNVIQNALTKALEDNKLQPVSNPEIEPKQVIQNEPFEFSVSFEVVPEIGEISFSLDSIDKLNVEISEADINHVIEQLKKQYTKWQVVDREIKDKDRVMIDYLMEFEGKKDLDNKMTNFPLEIGSQVMIPGFESGLIGAKPNEERQLTLKFPDDFQIAERASKEVTFFVTVKQIFEGEVPEVNSEFIKSLGIQSGELNDLKKQIRHSLEIEKNRIVKEDQKEKIFDALLLKNSVEVPDAMIDREAKNIHDEIYAHDRNHNHDHSEEEKTKYRELAKKRVILGLLMMQLAKQSNLKIDQNKVRERILEIASVYEKPEDVVAWLSSEERRGGVEAQVMEDQVIEKLIETIPVNEKTMTFAELKGFKTQA